MTLETTSKLAAENPWAMIGGLCSTAAFFLLVAVIGMALDKWWPNLSENWGLAIVMAISFGLYGGVFLTWGLLS